MGNLLGHLENQWRDLARRLWRIPQRNLQGNLPGNVGETTALQSNLTDHPWRYGSNWHDEEVPLS
jgi:hypothetical protein